jgi:hypothetical protein
VEPYARSRDGLPFDIPVQIAQQRRLKQAEAWFSSLINDVDDYAERSITRDGVIEAVNE